MARKKVAPLPFLDREPTLPEYTKLVGSAMSEAQFQAQVLHALQARGWWTFTVPRNVWKCWNCGRYLKKATHAGWPDVFAMKGNRSFFLELKDAKYKPTKEQLDVHAKLREAGHTVYVLRSTEWDRFLAIMEGDEPCQD